MAKGVIEVGCGVAEGVDFQFLDCICWQIDVQLVKDLRCHYAALTVCDQHDFLDVRVGTICFDVLITDAGFLGKQVESSLHDAFEEIAQNAICPVVDAKDWSSERFRQDIHIHLNVVPGDTAAVQEEPPLV